jgi:hypothetical protein
VIETIEQYQAKLSCVLSAAECVVENHVVYVLQEEATHDEYSVAWALLPAMRRIVAWALLPEVDSWQDGQECPSYSMHRGIPI